MSKTERQQCTFYLTFKNFPAGTPFTYGPTCHYMEDAVKACEKAIDEGAQHVEIAVYPHRGSGKWAERLVCGRDKKWRTFYPPESRKII